MADFPLPEASVTIRYSPSVEGTTIIYDVTDEQLQAS